MTDTAATAAPQPRTVSDRLLGAVGVLAILLALFFALFGGEEDGGGERPVAPPPAIAVLEPRDGAELSGRVALVFDAGTPMRQGPAGWVAAGRYHLHALVDGTEVMAAPDEVQPLGGTRYRWTLPPLPAGERRITLRWSGPDHRTLEEGGAPPRTVRVR